VIKKTTSVNTIAAAMFLTTSVSNAAVYVKYDGIDGEVSGPDNSGEWFVADSFSFGVEREMKESGEKGGTEDLNIGIGELQEIVIGKSKDASTVTLAQAALTGRGLGPVEVCVTDGDDRSGPQACYLHFVMERAYVKSWNTSAEADDRPTEEVAFYYNKIAFSYADSTQSAIRWDNEKNRPWPEGAPSRFNLRGK